MDEPSEPKRITRPVLDHLKDVVRDTGPAPSGSLPPHGPPARRLGRYELVCEIGRGGAGVVYRALDPELKRTVALKRISRFATENEKARFLREAQTAAQLRHPNIVGIHDVGEAEGEMYIAMELVEGRPLDPASPDLPRRRRIEIVRDVARAVQAAHDAGIAHRDLKPGNIMLRPDGQPVVLDFGLARDVEPESRVTATGAVVGTPAYFSPEQALAHPGHVDTRTDVYSLGVVLYELVTGRLPHDETTLYGQIKAVLEREPEAPCSIDPSIGRDLEAVLLKALEKEKRRRYPTAAAFAADLDAVLRGDPVSVRGGRALRWLRRRRKALALAGGGAAALAAILLFVRSPELPVPPPAAKPSGDPERADRLTSEAETAIQGAIAAVRKGKPKRAQEETLKAAERRLEEALKSFDTLPRPYLLLAGSQGLRGDHREALRSLVRMRQKVATVPEEPALVQEAHERILLFAVESLPSTDGFELARLRQQEGFDDFLKRLAKTSGRAAAIRAVLDKAVSGPSREAYAAAKQLAADEGDLDASPCVGHPLAALLAHNTNEIPRSTGPGSRCGKVLLLATALPANRRGQFVPLRQALQELIDSEIQPPAAAYYLLAHVSLAEEKPDEALKHADLCRPSADLLYAVAYLQGICWLARDPRQAGQAFERAIAGRPELEEGRYHLAAALAAQAGGASGEDRERLLGRALALLKGIAPLSRTAAAADAMTSYGRTLLRFKVSAKAMQTDPLLEPLRLHPRLGPELRRLTPR